MSSSDGSDTSEMSMDTCSESSEGTGKVLWPYILRLPHIDLRLVETAPGGRITIRRYHGQKPVPGSLGTVYVAYAQYSADRRDLGRYFPFSVFLLIIRVPQGLNFQLFYIRATC